MTRPIGAEHGLRLPLHREALRPGGEGQAGAPLGHSSAQGGESAGEFLDPSLTTPAWALRVPDLRPGHHGHPHPHPSLRAFPRAFAWPSPLASLPAMAPLQRLDPLSTPDTARLSCVTPGRLIAGSKEVSGGLLRVESGQGLVALALDEAPARGLVACPGEGEIALVLRSAHAVALSLDKLPVQALAVHLPPRLAAFGQLAGGTPEWALGLDVGQLGGADRALLTHLATEFRLGVQDLGQGIWVVDRLGGLHPRWPAQVRFEADPG